MKKKFLIAAMLVLLIMLPGLTFAEEQYIITDIAVTSADPNVPAPEPAPQPTPEPYAGPYEIEVDIANQITTVYRGEGRGQQDIARQMLCSTGTDSNTPLGSYIMPEIQKEDEREAWYYIGQYRLYVQYASRIVNGILFHSLPSEKKHQSPTQDSLDAFGEKASHGCIRLRPADSRWIAENCPPGTVVHIHEDAEADEVLRRLLRASSYVGEEMNYDSFLAGQKVFSLGSELPEVCAMQLKLIDLGYELSETDGFFGARTEDAVQDWQRDNGIEADGEINEAELDRLLSMEISAETRSKPGQAAVVRVDTALVLRSKPNSKSEKLDTLPNGTEVRVLEQEGGWYKIQVHGQTGYAGRKYIEILK